MSTLDVQRRLTSAYIAESPVTVIFTPYSKVQTPAKSWKFEAGTNRQPQVGRLIQGTTQAAVGRSRAPEGDQETDVHLLMLEYDAVVEVNDRFTNDGIDYVVVGVAHKNGYEIMAEVMRRG